MPPHPFALSSRQVGSAEGNLCRRSLASLSLHLQVGECVPFLVTLFAEAPVQVGPGRIFACMLTRAEQCRELSPPRTLSQARMGSCCCCPSTEARLPLSTCWRQLWRVKHLFLFCLWHLSGEREGIVGALRCGWLCSGQVGHQRELWFMHVSLNICPLPLLSFSLSSPPPPHPKLRLREDGGPGKACSTALLRPSVQHPPPLHFFSGLSID